MKRIAQESNEFILSTSSFASTYQSQFVRISIEQIAEQGNLINTYALVLFSLLNINLIPLEYQSTKQLRRGMNPYRPVLSQALDITISFNLDLLGDQSNGQQKVAINTYQPTLLPLLNINPRCQKSIEQIADEGNEYKPVRSFSASKYQSHFVRVPIKQIAEGNNGSIPVRSFADADCSNQLQSRFIQVHKKEFCTDLLFQPCRYLIILSFPFVGHPLIASSNPRQSSQARVLGNRSVSVCTPFRENFSADYPPPVFLFRYF